MEKELEIFIFFSRISNNHFRLQMGGNSADFALASKYSPNRDLTLRAKVNNSSQVIIHLQLHKSL